MGWPDRGGIFRAHRSQRPTDRRTCRISEITKAIMLPEITQRY